MSDELRTKSKSNIPPLQATSYTEVSRTHTSAISSTGSIVISSAADGEGSSLIAQLMAQRSAENGHKTLLVDLNLKNTKISETFGKERFAWNLKERAAEDKLTDLFSKVEGLDHLYILSAPLDSASIQFIKNTERAKHFFKVLEEQFDHVVVDTTSIETTNRHNADPVVLASAATHTALVLLANRTSKQKAQASIRQLQDAGAHIEGVIVNDKVNPSTKEQLLSFTKYISKVAPGFGQWLQHKVTHNEKLD